MLTLDAISQTAFGFDGQTQTNENSEFGKYCIFLMDRTENLNTFWEKTRFGLSMMLMCKLLHLPVLIFKPAFKCVINLLAIGVLYYFNTYQKDNFLLSKKFNIFQALTNFSG